MSFLYAHHSIFVILIATYPWGQRNDGRNDKKYVPDKGIQHPT